MGLNFKEDLEENVKRVNSMEEMLGNSLQIPFSASDSGSRKILANKQKEQSFIPIHTEKPLIGTGFENKMGDESSSVWKADDDYRVIGKISKFSFNPNHHYFLILENLRTHKLSYKERVCYKYNTEVYGYLKNNIELDRLNVGAIIPKGKVVLKSNAFDEFNNRCDGMNVPTIYVSNDRCMEDGIIIADYVSKWFSVPLFHPVKALIPSNVIPLNIYGNDTVYKCMPDIGESIENGKLLTLRQDKKEESLFSRSWERLKIPMLSDESFRVRKGTVIDIDVYANDPSIFENNIYLSQLKAYYDELIRRSNEIVALLIPYLSKGYTMEYELEKLYTRSKQTVEGVGFIDDKYSNNILLKIMVLEEAPAEIGDKFADRHGGKGVVSTIVPDDQMPKLPNGKPVGIIKNKSTMYGRENPGQNFEMSCTFVGDCIVDKIKSEIMTPEMAMDMIMRYIKIVSPSQYKELKDYIDFMLPLDPNTIRFYVDSVIRDDGIFVDALPITENFDIYKLDSLYKEFPWIQKCKLEVPVKDSNGNIRWVKSRNGFVSGRLYHTRMKQYAEEKFSVTSLAATTLTNENTRSHASKNYKEVFSDTPIKFGQMESDQFANMGTDYVVTNLMIHSSSPHARRSTEEMYTGDPFNVDIRLDEYSSSRPVEKLNAFLKTIGLRLNFYKKKKKKPNAVKMNPISFIDNSDKVSPISFVDTTTFDIDTYMKEYMYKVEKMNKKRIVSINPISWLKKNK